MPKLEKFRKPKSGVRLELRGPRDDWSNQNQEITIRREQKWSVDATYHYRLMVGCEEIFITECELDDAIVLLTEARRLP